MFIFKKWNIAALNSGVCFGPDQWSTDESTPLISSINPTTGESIARIKTGSLSDLEKLIQTAHTAFQLWRTVPAPKRGEVVRQIAEKVRQQKEELAQLITLEMGKPVQEALGEVQEVIDMAEFAVGQSRMLYGKTMHSERPAHRLYEQWHPLGVVGVITAFNFPMAVWAWNAFIAAICGNAVIWKPSSKVPLCAIAIQQICNEILHKNACPSVFTLFISADKKIAEQFVRDERISLVSFTGSTSVGEKVNTWVAERLGRCLLELGGNNAVIVDDSADDHLALPAVVFGAVGTSGQRCTTTRRVLVHEKKYDHFVSKLIQAYQSLKIGDPRQFDSHLGPLIDVSAVEAYRQAIEEIKKEGGNILYGGHALSGPGYFVEPTLARVEASCAIVQKETFVPILSIIKCQDFYEAVSIQNQTMYGLSSALFTQNLQHAEYFLSVLGSDCGIANINVGTSGAEIGAAFGGEKKTGGGREAGSDAWKAYMRRQTCTINWGQALPLSQGVKFDLHDHHR
ncbi:MAG: aldehyde dehydrogenase family protein [Gammaproteobacteria bacterium]|nr:aldehyde dehydrogenase family protein [Gammaproteobacteria bacterium]